MFVAGVIVGFGIAWYAAASRRLKKRANSPFFFRKITVTNFFIF